MPLDDGRVRELVAKVENLLAEVETLAQPGARAKAVEAIEALVELYGEGLARVMAHAGRTEGPAFTRTLAHDELLSHLLLLHDLHPVDRIGADGEIEGKVRPATGQPAGQPAFIPLSAVGVGGAPDGDRDRLG